MKIANIYASNVKRLKLANLQFDGKSFIVSGRNEQGKSSFIDAFYYLFKGKKAIPTEVIAKGSDKIEIYADLTEDFRIERTITANGTQLLIKPLEGNSKARYGSPQDICDKLFNEFTFDPLEFYNQKPEKQIETLKQFLPNPEQLDKIEQDIILKYNYRTEVNKEFKKNQLTFEAMRPPKVNLPNNIISISSLIEEKEFLVNQQNKYNKAIETKETLENKLIEFHKKIGNVKILSDLFTKAEEIFNKVPDELRKNSKISTIIDLTSSTINDIAQSYKGYKVDVSDTEKYLKELVIPETKNWDELIANIDKTIMTAEDTNADIRYRNDYVKAENEAGDAKVKADELTMAIEDLRLEKKRLFDEANLPIKGLTFGEAGIFYDDIPYMNLSSSKKLLISMKIGMALSPTLRTMFTKHANEFDDTRLKEIFKLAELEDYQLIVERINPLEGIPYIIIEDGGIKENHLSTITKESEEII